MLSEQLGRIISSASFWTPSYIPTSAWTEHAPFAFWLCDALRPCRFVELGTHYGYSYFTFCQGFSQLGTQTASYAVDTWLGDEHAGYYGEDVFNGVHQHNQGAYSGFSTLMRTTFEKASAYFEDGSIDLLHIDGRHFYDDVKSDYLGWLPKLAPNAIVLLHDTNVRQRDFGVWKFFQELAQQHPSFNFQHCNGLGVLAPGGTVPAALQPLFDASHAEAAQIRAIYAALGSNLTVRRALIAKTNALRAMLGYGTELSLEHAEPLGQIADGDQQIQEVLSAMLRASGCRVELSQSIRLHEAAALQRAAALEEKETQLASATADCEALQARLNSLAQALHSCEAVALKGAAAIEEKEVQLANAAADLAVLEARLSCLEHALQNSEATRQIAEARHLQDLRDCAATFVAEQKRQQQENAEFIAEQERRALEDDGVRRQQGILTAELSELRHANHAMRQELDAVYGSTSWKVMLPLQRVLGRAPLLRRAGRRAAKLVWWTATGQLAARLRERRLQALPGPPRPPHSDDAMEATIQALINSTGTPESARPIDLDYSLSLPLRYAPGDARAPGGTVGIFLHMYYPELAVEFRSYLRNIPVPADLYVSVPSEAAREQVLNAFQDWERGELDVRVLPNRGRDIAPKLIGFRDAYDRHELVLHLHSKRSDHASVLSHWRHHLLENLLGTPEIVRSVFTLFSHAPQVGMVAAAHFEPVRHWVSWGSNREDGITLGRRMGIEIDPEGVLDFPAGSMFWARSAALRPLLDLGLGFEDFPAEAGQVDGTLAHAIERLYFLVCENAGFDWIKVARPTLFSVTPSIISTRDVRELDQYFSQYVFRLLEPGGVRPRSLSLTPVPAPSPRLLDELRSHVLGEAEGPRVGSRVALGIVTYNNGEDELRLSVGAAIQSLRVSGLLHESTVLLLDNGADSAAAVPAGGAVRRLPSVGNVGFGAGHNRLMAEAFAQGADLYVALNPDGILHPDAVGALLRVVQAHDGRVLVEALQFPMEHPKPYDPVTLDTPWLSGACLAIPRAVYNVLGGFDDSFFMYCEDVDLSWRARAHGFALKTCPAALFLHAVTNRPTSKATLRMIFDSGVILARKWGSADFEAWLRPQIEALGALPPEVAPLGVPMDWRRYADFGHHFSFAKPRW